jgi:hypothetical protein
VRRSWTRRVEAMESAVTTNESKNERRWRNIRRRRHDSTLHLRVPSPMSNSDKLLHGRTPTIDAGDLLRSQMNSTATVPGLSPAVERW